jgi:twitching motility protein PilT
MAVQIHELLTFVVQQGASDLHLSAGEVPCVRIDGGVRRLDLDGLTAEDAKRMAYSIMTEKQKAFFENNLEIDFAIGLKGLARFRVNVFTQSRGVGMVLRHIPAEVWTLDKVNGPQIFQNIADSRRGLVLVTGPTGSGKTTTLAAMMHYINRTRSDHVLTIEDPIEFVHKPLKCIISQREVGPHTHSFSNALRSALREDPDVILVGELRDLETVSLALTAAETGHLVFGTLHTRSAPETIDRIVDQYPADQQAHVRTMLASSLKAVITQQLVRKNYGKGRVGAFEILLANPAVRNLIRENKLYQITSVMQASRGEGMQTMDMALKDLVNIGEISRENAIQVSGNTQLFDDEDGERRRPPKQNRLN